MAKRVKKLEMKIRGERRCEYSMEETVSDERREDGGNGGANDEIREESEEMEEVIWLRYHFI